MSCDYGFGGLEDKLIDLFKTYPPDFQSAEELIRQGADLNAVNKEGEDDNILSEILYAYCEVGQTICADGGDRENQSYDAELKEQVGKSMVQVIGFFLSHGFSLEKNDHSYGAKCLAMLIFSTFDEYMLHAARLLLDAGAKNAAAYSNDNETALEVIAAEASFQDICEHDHHLENLFEALYQMVLAADEGRPYQGISHYMKCCGKRIRRVLAVKPAAGEVFFTHRTPMSRHRNCFRQTLYLVYDEGYLITTKYITLWTDTVLQDAEMKDVSKHFPGVVGSVVSRITFGHNEIQKGTTCYGQPIVNLEMDSGAVARFTTDFGETDKEDSAAYFSIKRGSKWPGKRTH